MKNKNLAFQILSLITLCITVSLISCQAEHSQKKQLTSKTIYHQDNFYSNQVQPIFDNKCIACHSCYNSPCQLNLTSFEGLSRGASHINLYDFPKVEPREPTRLYVDGGSEKKWREKGFFPVIGKDRNNSFIKLISELPGIESGKQEIYDSEYSRVCVDSTAESNLDVYKKANPAGRMPYGLPALKNSEIEKIKKWLTSGVKGPATITKEEKVLNHKKLKPHIKKWESFFNKKGIKDQIVARYLYEHLFLAHIYFEDFPLVNFRLVRSKTKYGPIQEIGTSFPFSDPGKTFTYRLRPVTNTIVHKVHIPFKFSNKKLERWKKSFLDTKWEKEPKKLLTYDKQSSNPFKTFKNIPKKARYELFLNNSAYFIMTFIKGPVCRGQTALNVINDHFWVFFLDPKHDALVNSKEVYDRVSEQVKFPAFLNGDFNPLADFRESYWDSVKTKFNYIQSKESLGINSLWQGNKNNPNANITVYRHFDSATVLHGLKGQKPKTVWVLDYHVFESIYYNLSAGYNVFGPLLHQLNSRLYMEISRVASEDLFLSFLPKNVRKDLRMKWNMPVPNQKESFTKASLDFFTADAREKFTEKLPYQGDKINTSVTFKTDEYKNELLDTLTSDYFSSSQTKVTSNNVKREIENISSSSVKYLPDAMFILTGTKTSPILYTLIHNKDHYNVGMLLFEDDRRNRENDSIDLLKGAAASYANLIFDLRDKNLSSFISDLKAIKNKRNSNQFVKKYGLSRKDQSFWEVYREISRLTYNPLTTERGYIDLNRYINI